MLSLRGNKFEEQTELVENRVGQCFEGYETVSTRFGSSVGGELAYHVVGFPSREERARSSHRRTWSPQSKSILIPLVNLERINCEFGKICESL